MSIKNSPCPNWENYFSNHIKTEFEASAGMNVDRHLEFHVDATPIGDIPQKRFQETHVAEAALGGVRSRSFMVRTD